MLGKIDYETDRNCPKKITLKEFGRSLYLKACNFREKILKNYNTKVMLNLMLNVHNGHVFCFL